MPDAAAGAAAVSLRFDDAGKALALAALVRDWPNQTLVPPDGAVAERSAGLVTRWRLRGADAVYAVVAQQVGTTLIALDRRQVERLPPEVRTARPAEGLAQDLTGLPQGGSI